MKNAYSAYLINMVDTIFKPEKITTFNYNRKSKLKKKKKSKAAFEVLKIQLRHQTS